MNEQMVTTLALPPPFDLNLFDGDRRIGWLTPSTVGFSGFANEAEAMHAAWVAHRTLLRRLRQRDGRRPPPIDVEPLVLKPDDSVHASGRRIAVLVRPATDGRSGPDSFGFELTFPSALDEVSGRAKALLIYRTLRRSGLRWSMWLRDGRRESRPAVADVAPAVPARVRAVWPLLGGAGLAVAFMILALFVPEHLGAAVAGAGLTGLFILRLYLWRIGWPPRSRAGWAGS